MSPAAPDPSAPSAAPPREPWTPLQVGLVALLAAVCAARFLWLEADPPYLIYEHTNTYVADEAWYLKCALNVVRFGTWRNDHDLSPFTHNPLQTFLHAGTFAVFGIGVAAARAVTVAFSIAGIACTWRIVRGQGRTAAAAASLLVATTVSHFGQSRLAAPENAALTLSLASIVAWAHPRRGAGACAASMALAAAAYLTKVSFAFTPLVVGAAWAWEGVGQWRGGDRRRAAAKLATVAAAAAVVVALPLVMTWYAPTHFATQNRANLEERAMDLGLASVLRSEWRMVLHVGLDRWRLVIAGAALAGLAAAWAVPLLRRRAVALTPPVRLLVAWGVAGAVLHGWTPVQPPRYYVFVVVPLAAAATSWAPLVAERARDALLVALVAAHVALQVPAYAEWTSRSPWDSRRRMAADVAARIDAEPGVPVIVGLHSTTVAMASAKCRPLDTIYATPDEARDRLLHGRPGFAIGTARELDDIRAAARGAIAGWEEISSYRVFGDYPRGRPVVFARLRWE